MSNHLIISHSADNDGHASAAVIRHFLEFAGNGTEYVGVDYDEISPSELKEKCSGKHVWLSDFCFGDDWMLSLKNLEFGNLSFTWIDHHKTAIERAIEKGYDDLPGLRAAKIRDGSLPAVSQVHSTEDGEEYRPVAACELAWIFMRQKYRVDDQTPPTIKYLSKWDTWNKDEEWDSTTLPVQYYVLGKMKAIPSWENSREFWDKMIKVEVGDQMWDWIIKSGNELVEYQTSRNFVSAKRAYRAIWKGLRLMVLNQGEVNSGAFESLPEEDAMMCFKQNRTGEWTVSLYGHPNSTIDLSKYASEMGGGGHFSAAGWQMKDINDLGLVKEGEPGFQTESWNRRNPTEAH